MTRRIAAIVLSNLACELVRQSSDYATHVSEDSPFAILVERSKTTSGPSADDSRTTIDAVSQAAWRCGIRPGQRVAEASAFVSGLRIYRLAFARIEEARAAVAEVARQFGTTVSLDLERTQKKLRTASDTEESFAYPLGMGAGPRDTVWLDITGCSRLVGGEDVLCAELREKLLLLGHRARIGIAPGPRIAQAIARWGTSPGELIVSKPESRAALSRLPVAALPLPMKVLTWFTKLGVLRVSDLVRLNRRQLRHRLGQSANTILPLVDGIDATPLLPFHSPRQVCERESFDDPLRGTNPLMFVIRRLANRACIRLEARGEATRHIELWLSFDPSIVALQNSQRLLPIDSSTSELLNRHASNEALVNGNEKLSLKLTTPIHRDADLVRALHAKIERLHLPAPIVAVELRLQELDEQVRSQLDLSENRAGASDPHALSQLVAELSASIGEDNVGCLSVTPHHLPEAQSTLVAPSTRYQGPSLGPSLGSSPATPAPTRLLTVPYPLDHLRLNELVGVHSHLLTIKHRRAQYRLQGINWWGPRPQSRDYYQVVFQLPTATTTTTVTTASSRPPILAVGSVYVSRAENRIFLQGWYD